MQEFAIYIRCFNDILDFVKLAQDQPFPVLAGNDRQQVSAKSHMGMCSLNFQDPIRIMPKCSAEEFEAFRTAAAPFLHH